MEVVVTVPLVAVVLVVEPSAVVLVEPSAVVLVVEPASVVPVVVVVAAVSSSGARKLNATMLMAPRTTATASPISQGLGWAGGT
jgi:hypothetical protein